MMLEAVLGGRPDRGFETQAAHHVGEFVAGQRRRVPASVDLQKHRIAAPFDEPARRVEEEAVELTILFGNTHTSVVLWAASGLASGRRCSATISLTSNPDKRGGGT